MFGLPYKSSGPGPGRVENSGGFHHHGIYTRVVVSFVREHGFILHEFRPRSLWLGEGSVIVVRTRVPNTAHGAGLKFLPPIGWNRFYI